jgi:hypothetical protein
MLTKHRTQPQPSVVPPMSTQILSRRLHLPNEVLVEILSYLCPRDIATCQRSCRQFNDVVICSQFLQYLLRVGRSGLYDPMLPGYTIPQRIEALERWEADWRNLEARSSCPSQTHCRLRIGGSTLFCIQNSRRLPDSDACIWHRPRVRIHRSACIPTRRGNGSLDQNNTG